MAAKRKPTPEVLLNEPLMASYEKQTFAAAATRTRSNRAASIERTKRYANIDDGLIPFKYTSGKYNTNSTISCIF